MWPWGHLAFGYLCYFVYSRSREDARMTRASIATLILGTQLPDLVDKPLAWTVQLLPNGRSLAHSVFVTALVIVGVTVLARRYRVPDLGPAFGIGYGTHLVGDALYPLIQGDFEALGFLLWPVVPPLEYSTPQSFGAHLARLDLSTTVWFELGLFVTASLIAWRFLRP
ncbi:MULTISPECIES: metal-dependent hydrolase [Salinibaculum]|uniref:metal-dependent hydrolase n=1 Tax=Salinibaculum TaxID=2732368 RepID=UPI003623E6BC